MHSWVLVIVRYDPTTYGIRRECLEFEFGCPVEVSLRHTLLVDSLKPGILFRPRRISRRNELRKEIITWKR